MIASIDGKATKAGSGAKDAQLLKFTRKFLQQFGKPGMSGGSADTKNMGMPANLGDTFAFRDSST